MAKTMRTLRVTRSPGAARWPSRSAADRQRARRRRHQRQELAGRVLQAAAAVVTPAELDGTVTAGADHPVADSAVRWVSNHRSVWSVGSLLSAGSLFSALSAGSVLSIGSVGSILSIGSAGSVLSIGSAGSILSIGSLGARNATGRVGDPERAGHGGAELDTTVRALATVAAVAALAAGARPHRCT